jgi:hypothetical protein
MLMPAHVKSDPDIVTIELQELMIDLAILACWRDILAVE